METPAPSSTIITLFQEELVEFLRRGQERAILLRRPILVSVVQPLTDEMSPLQIFRSGSGSDNYRSFWAKPSEEFWMVGLGRTVAVSVHGLLPVEKARAECNRLMEEDCMVVGPKIRGTGPVLTGAFRFDARAQPAFPWKDTPNGLLSLPRLLFTTLGRKTWLTVNIFVSTESNISDEAANVASSVEKLTTDLWTDIRTPRILDQTHSSWEEWAGWMDQAMEVIGSGDLTKVVLSRRMIFHGDGPFSIETTLDSLCKTYPFCSVFAVGNGLECFIGASPEDLVRLENGQVRVSCLAGSAVRGATLEEEERLIKQLSNSAKDRREHEVVVTAISQGLSKVCKDVQWDSEPRVVQLPTIQHLATFFTACATKGSDILQIVSTLHPTPAVGGVPTERALKMIRCLEGDRGWYAGPVGWVDFHGEGQFNVAIRSALVKGNQATLFAGSGIVEGSDPLEEFKETNWKFQPLLNALHQR